MRIFEILLNKIFLGRPNINKFSGLGNLTLHIYKSKCICICTTFEQSTTKYVVCTADCMLFVIWFRPRVVPVLINFWGRRRDNWCEVTSFRGGRREVAKVAECEGGESGGKKTRNVKKGNLWTPLIVINWLTFLG